MLSRKTLTILLLGSLLLAFSVQTTRAGSNRPAAKNTYSSESTGQNVLILVNETIDPAIADHLAIFEQDLALDGYNALISTVSNGLTPPEIKSIIKSYYTDSNISGCILVGDIKAAYTETHTVSLFNSDWYWLISLDAADMYYMDLDGYWDNVTHPDFYAQLPPSVTHVTLDASCQTFYDEYIVYPNETEKWDYSPIENKTQYRAEIWVSRIMGHNLEIPGKNETEIIKGFLEWDHAFRANQKKVEDLVYLLNAIGPGYNDQNMNYSSIFDSTVEMEYVTKRTYSACLNNPSGSKLIYLTAHSCPLWHCLYDANLDVQELADSNKTSVFYILNACSSCRWDQCVSSPTSPNFLGGIYVFDKRQGKTNNGLGAIGFTGVGGFLDLAFFTDYLNENLAGSYGEAYKYWFNEHLMQLFSVCCCVYLGDPTIGPRIPMVKAPNLSLFSPEIDGFTVTINGVTLPGNPHATVVRINWNWGDGYLEDHWFPTSHTYSQSGIYTVNVTSYQSDGLSESKSVEVSVDNIAPDVGVPFQNPPSGGVNAWQEVTVLVNVTDFESGVKNVTLSCSTDNGTSWTSRLMTYNTSTELYEGKIDGQSAGTWVKYGIVAYDWAGNNNTRDNAGQFYVYTVIPEFPSATILTVFMALTLLATALIRKKRTRRLD